MSNEDWRCPSVFLIVWLAMSSQVKTTKTVLIKASFYYSVC